MSRQAISDYGKTYPLEDELFYTPKQATLKIIWERHGEDFPGCELTFPVIPALEEAVRIGWKHAKKGKRAEMAAGILELMVWGDILRDTFDAYPPELHINEDKRHL